MELTRRAAEQIMRLRGKRELAEDASLRVSRRGAGVSLRWDSRGARETDLLVTTRGVRLVVDARTYLRLADLTLDCERRDGATRFLLRPRRWNGQGAIWMEDPAGTKERRRKT